MKKFEVRYYFSPNATLSYFTKTDSEAEDLVYEAVGKDDGFIILPADDLNPFAYYINLRQVWFVTRLEHNDDTEAVPDEII
jgi:hypothetical protein